VHLHAVRRGAAMVRVHDASGHVQALAVQAALGSG
jgi:dihydropteroate synthase